MTSFAPKDASTGRWKGGKATTANPKFVYRSFDVKNGRNAGTTQKVVDFIVEFVTGEDFTPKGFYNVGNAQYCAIKSGPSPDASNVDEGPSIGPADPERDSYTPYKDSDFITFMSSLVTAGFPESLLQNGDVNVLDGLEVEVYLHEKKEGDKYPLLLIKSVTLPANFASATGRATTAAPDASPAAKEALEQLVHAAIAEAGGPVTQATLVKTAMSLFKGQEVKNDVVKLLSNTAALSSGSWNYDATTKTVSL